MGPRFTRGEYWLLETVVEGRCPLCFLRGTENHLYELFNKPGHGLDRHSLVDAIGRLIGMGLIVVGKPSPSGVILPIQLGFRDIEAALDEPGPHVIPNCMTYGLTDEGSRQWEGFAAPEWDRYLSVYSHESRSGRWKIGMAISITPWRVERWLEGARFLGRLIEPTRVHRRTIRSWRATYWKSLPEAYLASFRFVEVDRDLADAPAWFAELNENCWYRWK